MPPTWTGESQVQHYAEPPMPLDPNLDPNLFVRPGQRTKNSTSILSACVGYAALCQDRARIKPCCGFQKVRENRKSGVGFGVYTIA